MYIYTKTYLKTHAYKHMLQNKKGIHTLYVLSKTDARELTLLLLPLTDPIVRILTGVQGVD